MERMSSRRNFICIGGSILSLSFGGCISNDNTSDQIEAGSPSDADSDKAATNSSNQQTEETPTKDTYIDLGFPVANLETEEVITWDQIGSGYDRARVLTSHAVYANGNSKVAKLPHGTGEIVWEINRGGSSVVPYKNGSYVGTDSGVYNGSSGRKLFSVGQSYHPIFVSDGVWYFDNDGFAHKYGFKGERLNDIFVTNFKYYGGGTIDEERGIMYLPTAGGLFGIEIDRSTTERYSATLDIGSGSKIDLVSKDLDGGEVGLTDDIGVYIADDKTVVSFSRTTFTKQSTFSIDAKPRHTTIADGKLITRNTAFSGPFDCFDVRTGEKVWSTNDLPLANASQRKPIVYNGYLLIKLQNRRLGVYDIESGMRLTTIDLSQADGNSLEGKMDKLFVDDVQLLIANRFGYKRLTGGTETHIES